MATTKKMTGYHGTKRENVKSIKKNGLRSSQGHEHWLGDGIYFFEGDRDEAKWWVTDKKNLESLVIYEAQIEVRRKSLLDLITKKDYTLYSDFRREINKIIKASSVKSQVVV